MRVPNFTLISNGRSKLHLKLVMGKISSSNAWYGAKWNRQTICLFPVFPHYRRTAIFYISRIHDKNPKSIKGLLWKGSVQFKSPTLNKFKMHPLAACSFEKDVKDYDIVLSTLINSRSRMAYWHILSLLAVYNISFLYCVYWTIH